MKSAPVFQVRSVLIPLLEDTLLLPNVVVAEVMNLITPQTRQDMPDWFLGDIGWRGTSVPVVSFEGMMGQPIVEPAQRGRTIILNTINGEASLPHIGIVAQAIPSLVQVTVESIDLSDSSREPQSSLIKQTVTINDKQAIIPDLDELERLVMSSVGTG